MVSGGLAEWSIAPDCKSGLNSTVVRIHQPPPNNLGVLAEIGYAPRSRQCLTVERGHSGANPGASTKITLEFDRSGARPVNSWKCHLRQCPQRTELIGFRVIGNPISFMRRCCEV